MRDYRRMMEQVTLSDQKKEEIMEMIENKNTAKRHMPKAAKIVLAAALAVGCVLSIAAGLPAQVYNFMSRGTITALPGTGEFNMTLDGETAAPVKAEDGRLWFEAGGQKVDITDKVDEDTPYIYEHTDPATGKKGYVVAGGTVENFGWVEISQMDNVTAMSGENYSTVSIAELYEAQEAQKAQGEGYGGEFHMVEAGTNRPWLDKAIEQLGLDIG